MKALEDVEEITEVALLKEVSEAVENCPACICSAINQAKLPMVEWDIPGEYHFGEFHNGTHGEHRYRVNFDYKKARDEYRAEQENNKAESVGFSRLFD